MAKPLFEAQVSPLAGRLRPHAVSAATRLPVVILINCSGPPQAPTLRKSPNGAIKRPCLSDPISLLSGRPSPDPACKTSGVSARPHDLRATCASLLIDGRQTMLDRAYSRT